MSISATLALDISDIIEENNNKTMPGLISSSESSKPQSHYSVTLGTGPLWWS
ncbi:UNVERIFIED_CONTAM: hypothetical protein PYX00_010087 [Menopon gallinae]|uniref:Uncharacterized protein n=1 Tax=Menopon gallinae TaxID=328185 RepID=A0AAW2HDT8_9NEOP